MAISKVTAYNQMLGVLLGDPTKQWNDSVVGAFMVVVCDNTYSPNPGHTTSFDLAGVITVGDGAPVNLTGRSLDSATTPAETLFKSNNIDFGSAVTLTGKYIVLVQPAVAGVFDGSNDKLIWYFDLDDSSSSAQIDVVADEFIYTMPSNGWMSIKEAA